MLGLTLYGVPRSLWRSLRSVFSGTLGDVVWKVLVLAVLGIGGYVLLAVGGAGGAFVGAILLSALWEDDVRAAAANIFNRNWAEVERPW